jgi:hypothetical protein
MESEDVTEGNVKSIYILCIVHFLETVFLLAFAASKLKLAK